MRARGLDGFMHDLEIAESDFLEGVGTLTEKLAEETGTGARSLARSGKLTGASMGSIRVVGPRVTAGEGVPWYGFADFGGRVGAGRRISRPYIKGGRWLYPAVKAIGVIKQADDLIEDSTRAIR